MAALLGRVGNLLLRAVPPPHSLGEPGRREKKVVLQGKETLHLSSAASITLRRWAISSLTLWVSFGGNAVQGSKIEVVRVPASFVKKKKGEFARFSTLSVAGGQREEKGRTKV